MLGVVGVWTLTLLVSTALAGRRLSLLRLSIAIAISQILFHTLFVFGAVGPGGVIIDGHEHHQHHLALLEALPPGTLAALQADAAMWLWHALAAVVTTAILYRGERILQHMDALAAEAAELTRLALVRVSSAPAWPLIPRILAPLRAAAHAPTAPHLSTHRHRGPPVAVEH